MASIYQRSISQLALSKQIAELESARRRLIQGGHFATRLGEQAASDFDCVTEESLAQSVQDELVNSRSPAGMTTRKESATTDTAMLRVRGGSRRWRGERCRRIW